MYSLSQKRDQLDKHFCEVLRACVGAVHRDYPDARMILYGSQATGQATQYSDVDLLILLNSDVSSQDRKDIHDRLYEIGLKYDAVISVIIKIVSRWERPISRATSLYKAIKSEGILVA